MFDKAETRGIYRNNLKPKAEHLHVPASFGSFSVEVTMSEDGIFRQQGEQSQKDHMI